jgi:DNA excision repair protein ERCC-4
MPRKDLEPGDITAIIDTREQTPWELSPLQTKGGTLTTGDYSVAGLEHVIAVERKSLSDLLGCIGQERERFEREMHRIQAFPVKALVIEASWAELEKGEWRSRVTSAAVVGSLLGWMAMGVPVVLAGDHKRAGQLVSRLLFVAARRRWREAQSFIPTLRIAQ